MPYHFVWHKGEITIDYPDYATAEQETFARTYNEFECYCKDSDPSQRPCGACSYWSYRLHRWAPNANNN